MNARTHRSRPHRNKPASVSEASPAAGPGNAQAAKLRVARGLLDNIARRLSVCRASAIVCHIALSAENSEFNQDIAAVLQWSITEELERQIDRIGQIMRSRPKTSRPTQPRTRRAARKMPSEELAVEVSGDVLGDICDRLSRVKNSSVVCHTALVIQNVDNDIDVAAVLSHGVIELLDREIPRLAAIGGTKTKKGGIIAGVEP